MEVISLEELVALKQTCAVALGFFDGVHLGHQSVICNAVNYAKKNQVKSVVITFDRSPKVALGIVEDEGCLTPRVQKLRILEEMGVDCTLVLTFDTNFLNLSADSFIDNYLLRINASYVAVGFDFKFGRGGAGSSEYLLSLGKFKVEISEPVQLDGVKVSSTEIKRCLKLGDLKTVNRMLGRHFLVEGTVVRGNMLGRTIGFPTANLKLESGYLFSLRGVYATTSNVNGERFTSMTNIGFNPTANLQEAISIETYIFNFDNDIYGAQISIEFLSKIRDEVKFEGIEALIAQLEKDKNMVASMQVGT